MNHPCFILVQRHLGVGREETIWGTSPHPFSEILSVGKKEVGHKKAAETDQQAILCGAVMALYKEGKQLVKAHLNIKLRENLPMAL